MRPSLRRGPLYFSYKGAIVLGVPDEGAQSMNARVRAKALATLDRMTEIIRAERIVHGEYATEEVDAPERVDQVCQGRRYCLLGAVWVSYGAKLDPDSTYRLEGVDQYKRDAYLAKRPALRAVYDALNRSAERRIARGSYRTDSFFRAPAEALFEGGDLGRSDLLRLVASARREIVKA